MVRLRQAQQRQWLEYSDRAQLVFADGATQMIHHDRPYDPQSRSTADDEDYSKEDGIMNVTMTLMKAAMFKLSRSQHDFDETAQMIRANALRVGWDVPWRFELQQHYRERGLSDMTRTVNVYLCNSQAGYDIMKKDVYKPMAVLMPTAVSVYETSGGQVYVSRMNLKRMSAMFAGKVRKALEGGGAKLEKALEGVVET